MPSEWTRKQTQVVWADLEAWVQQLYEDHRVRVRFTVFLPAPGDDIKPGVVTEAFRVHQGGREELLQRVWAVFDERVSGIVEQYALRHVSKLLLEMENEKERAERQAPLVW